MGGLLALRGQGEVELPAYSVVSARAALREPSATFAMPVSSLRFEPLADVQARSLPEGQADVALRGGIFENTGFRLGALALLDPQTGHYSAEIPVPPAMLSNPRIITGVGNAVEGLNASAGTVGAEWLPVRPGGELALTAGENDASRWSAYQGWSARGFGADAEVARSDSQGRIRFGDHRFQRAGGRLQLAAEESQTDLFFGYQAKFFGWPNLYTPFGSPESENLETALAALNHRRHWGRGNWLEAGLFWRRNKDDYAFNRFAPLGPVHPYQHTTWVNGAAAAGRVSSGDWALGFSAAALADRLKSTSLIYGRFHTRSYAKLGLVPERRWSLSGGRMFTAKLGGTCDDTNREGTAGSPVAEIALAWPRAEGGSDRLAVGYSETTQVPTYTALNASPSAGLFRGNSGLGRSRSRNLEISGDATDGAWESHAAVFLRSDSRLVDWTFRKGVAVRTANAVDIDMAGVELVLRRSLSLGDLVLGYTGLAKSADYGGAAVDGSFYALNYPRHRLTAAVVARMGSRVEVRMDNEARLQADNPLRTAGGRRAFISALGLFWRLPLKQDVMASLQIDNLWNSSFQAVPSVPAAGREASVGIRCRW